MEPGVVTGLVAVSSSNFLHLARLLSLNNDACSRSASIACFADQFDDKPVSRAMTSFVQKQRRPGPQVVDGDIDIAIVVKVCERCAAAGPGTGKSGTESSSDIREFSIA
jgi:hypothetical protein